MWTLTIGLGSFLVGPSLITLYDEVGKWATLAVLASGAAAALCACLIRRARAQVSS